jgi:hypothetical protein
MTREEMLSSIAEKMGIGLAHLGIQISDREAAIAYALARAILETCFVEDPESYAK